MSRHLKNFSINNIDGMIDCLNDYKAYINNKANEFVRELADVGIKVAQGHLGEWNNYIFFERLDEENGTIIVASDINVLKVWYTDKKLTNKREYEVSPLLLAEFGSGWLSDNKWDINGVGQGTMPSQTHALNPNGWYWYDESGVKHHSIGELPSYPLYTATVGMLTEIQTVARKVFG